MTEDNEMKVDATPETAEKPKTVKKTAAKSTTAKSTTTKSTTKKTVASKSASAGKAAQSKSGAAKSTTAKSAATAKSTTTKKTTAASKSASAGKAAQSKSGAAKSTTSKSAVTAKSTTTKKTTAKETAATSSPETEKEAASAFEAGTVQVREEVATAKKTEATVEAVASGSEVENKEPEKVEAPTEEKSEIANEERAAEDKKDYILEVEGLKTYFPIAKTIFGKPKVYLRAVDDVGFKIARGTTLGVVGESGCGKTTLGRTILKLYEPNGGKIVFDGDDLTRLKRSEMLKYRTKMQLIFQDPYSSLPPRMTVGSIIAEAVKIHKIVPKEQVYDYVQSIMKYCGLQPQYYDRYPHEFSGGQRQRICIARALAVKPELVICDEPVSALDVSIQAQIINLLKSLQRQMRLTYLFISHDLSVVKYITDRILVMYLGNMMELGDTDEIFDNPLHPYTQALFSAVPVPDPDVKMNRIILEGDIPSPANPPKGCKFHTRCSKCMDVCKFKQPEYVGVETKSGKDHFVACHLYNEEVMNSLPAYTEEYNRLVEEQRAKEEQARIKKESSGWYKFKKKLVGVFKRKKVDKATDDKSKQTDAAQANDNTDDTPDHV